MASASLRSGKLFLNQRYSALAHSRESLYNMHLNCYTLIGIKLRSQLNIVSETENIILPRMAKHKKGNRIVAGFRTCPEIVFEVDCRCVKMLVERDEAGLTAVGIAS